MAQVSATPPKVTAILVNVNQAAVNNIVPEGTAPAEAAQRVGEYASWAMDELSQGGLLLSADSIARMEESVGQLQTPEDVVKAVETGQRRREGQVVVEWVVDPTYLPNLEEIAQSSGRSVQQLMQDVMDTAMAKGWLYEWNPEPVPLMFSEEDLLEVGEIIGVENPTGTDITSWIRQQVGFELGKG
jgi:hypothetical protein